VNGGQSELPRVRFCSAMAVGRKTNAAMVIRNTLIVLLPWDCFEGEIAEYIKIAVSPTIFYRSGIIYVHFLGPYLNPSAKIGCSSLIRSLSSRPIPGRRPTADLPLPKGKRL
jgi:hypothetical protein